MPFPVHRHRRDTALTQCSRYCVRSLSGGAAGCAALHNYASVYLLCLSLCHCKFMLFLRSLALIPAVWTRFDWPHRTCSSANSFGRFAYTQTVLKPLDGKKTALSRARWFKTCSDGFKSIQTVLSRSAGRKSVPNIYKGNEMQHSTGYYITALKISSCSMYITVWSILGGFFT